MAQMTNTSAPPSEDAENDIEEGLSFAPRFGTDGLIPVTVTCARTGEVLMLAYMNDVALARTIETGEAHYWSRSRRKLWRKGEESGNAQHVVELRTDCDQDSLWMKVEMKGVDAACHTGRKSCFYRSVPVGQGDPRASSLHFVDADKLFDPKDVYRHADAAKGNLKTAK